MSLIEKLTPEQEALIPVYRQKWRAIALSTERIDREKAAEAVKATYVLNCVYDQVKWNSFESVVKECGWIFADKNTYIVCDRHTKLSFDNQNRLHAEGEPAIEFIDGYSLYSYHSVTLPEKYGKIHPQQWQATWLLTNDRPYHTSVKLTVQESTLNFNITSFYLSIYTKNFITNFLQMPYSK